jgi:UDP-glucose 4-epimerase
LAEESGVVLIQTDLLHSEVLAGPFEAVVHAAATSPAPGISTRQLVEDNAIATVSLIRACERWKTRMFVFFSSISIYGDIVVPLVNESCPMVNPDAYGMTKRLSEMTLAEYASSLSGLALRLPGIIGPWAHRNWLSTTAAKLRAGEPIRAFNLDAPFNNAVHVVDLETFIGRVLDRGWKGFDAVVLGARGAIKVQGAIERLAEGLGVNPTIESVPTLKPSFSLSSERAMSRWGYDPMEIAAMLDKYASEIMATT